MWIFSLSYAVCFNFAPICIIVRLAFVFVYLLILYCFACCMRCLCLSFLLSLCVVRRLGVSMGGVTCCCIRFVDGVYVNVCLYVYVCCLC